MFLAKIVLAVFTCSAIIYNGFVGGQDDSSIDDLDEPPREEDKIPPLDNHTFVALIDIVFTDGKKRTCTGTIIHDNVVITAGHCFVDIKTLMAPELTASFVVIGTKKMYDTGYENYLPIERVITHPKYKGWTADLALVYTFAGMTSDKPGNIIPLVAEMTLTPVDSNVTVFSWGHCTDEEPTRHTNPPKSDKLSMCDSSEEMVDGTCEEKQSSDDQDASEAETSHRINQMKELAQTRGIPDEKNRGKYATEGPYPDTPHALRLAQHKNSYNDMPPSRTPVSKTTKRNSRYLTSNDLIEKEKNRNKRLESYDSQRHRFHKTQRNSSRDEDIVIVISTADLKFRVKNDLHRKKGDTGEDKTRRLQNVKTKDNNERLRAEEDTFGLEIIDVEKEQKKTKKKPRKTYFKNWRRQMGAKQNKLSVETFGFVNVQTCKKLVDRALPALFSINPNEVVCYSTEDHYITDEDSGAPAIRQGHLVAVTLGGVECEGDHVAIGIKMSCFCPWIAENLPDGGVNMQCCKDCCTGNDRDEARYYKHYRHKNKYLY